MTEETLEVVASELTKHHSTPWTPGETVTTILICTNSLLRMGLTHLLAKTCFAVSDTAFNAALPLPCGPDEAPTLFILDTSHGSHEATAVIHHLKSQHPQARLVVMADQFELTRVIGEHRAGADGFFLTSSSRDVLIKSLELVMLGQTILPSATVLAMLNEMACCPERPSHGLVAGGETNTFDLNGRKLSTREAQILGCIMGGAPNKVIARKLDVAEATVKVHVKAILRKVGAANRTQAAMWATTHLPRNDGVSLNA